MDQVLSKANIRKNIYRTQVEKKTKETRAISLNQNWKSSYKNLFSTN
jgi:hypothetical protein